MWHLLRTSQYSLAPPRKKFSALSALLDVRGSETLYGVFVHLRVLLLIQCHFHHEAWSGEQEGGVM